MALPGMGVETSHAPEWTGAHSAKFADKHSGHPLSRRIVTTNLRNGDDVSLARNGFAQYFTDARGLVSVEHKRIFDIPGSDVHQWRPSKRSLSEPGCDHCEKPEGRRYVEPAPARHVSIREKRHIRQVESKEEFHDRVLGPKTVVRENGLRAGDTPAQEVDISTEMARKVRPLDLLSQRNGMGCRVLGDKNYRHPEYESSFFKAGELIAGSGFSRGHYKKTQSRHNTSIDVAVGDPERRLGKSFKEKEQERILANAQSEVQVLTGWEASTLKECDPSYEHFEDSDDEVGVVATS